MKIVFNTNYKQASSYMWSKFVIPRLIKAGYDVSRNDWDNYKKYDLAIFMSPDSEVIKAKKENPNIVTIIADPKTGGRKWRIIDATNSDFLFVTSLEQRDHFLKLNKNIQIYHHFVDLEGTFKKHFKGKDERIIIAYHGNKTHLMYMDKLMATLDLLSQKYNIEFWAIYNIKTRKKWTKNLPKKCLVKHIQWTEDVYSILSEVDIGVVPTTLPINKKIGKWTTKTLENYFAYEKNDYLVRFKYCTNPSRIYPFSQFYVPIVADFTPSCCQMIQHNKSGFLVYSKEGWYDALEKLIINPELRNQMSRNLKEYIDNNCSPEINFNIFLKFLKSIK